MLKIIQKIWDSIIISIGVLIFGGLFLTICYEYPIILIPTIIIGLWLYLKNEKENEKIRIKQQERERNKITLDKAKNGDPVAKFDYGEIVLFGRGVKSDKDIAIRWIMSAATMNEPRALFKMGEIYKNGEYGHPIDKIKSINFFEKAAQQEHIEAKKLLAPQLKERKERYQLEKKLIQLYEKAWMEYQSLGSALNINNMTGIEFEEYVRKLYIHMKYEVISTKASNDQGTDLIATKDGKKTSIQVKRYKKSVGNKAVQETIAGAKFHGCDKTAVVTNSTFTKSAKELAKKSDTELIDGKKLLDLVKKHSTEEVTPFDLVLFNQHRDNVLKYAPSLYREIYNIEKEIDTSGDYSSQNDVSCRSFKWAYQCPLKWEDLQVTTNDNVKFCNQCNSNVYYTNDVKSLSQLIYEGKCTASIINTIGSEGEGEPEDIMETTTLGFRIENNRNF